MIPNHVILNDDIRGLSAAMSGVFLNPEPFFLDPGPGRKPASSTIVACLLNQRLFPCHDIQIYLV